MFGTVAAGGALTPANPAYTAKELQYQLEQTKSKIVIASAETLAVALEAAKLAGIPKSSVLLFGNREIDGVQPYNKVLLDDKEMKAVEYTYEEACNTIAYLCFSSGTTGKCDSELNLSMLSIIINIMRAIRT
jgi:4-coumarate--CoA ligase